MKPRKHSSRMPRKSDSKEPIERHFRGKKYAVRRKIKTPDVHYRNVTNIIEFYLKNELGNSRNANKKDIDWLINLSIRAIQENQNKPTKDDILNIEQLYVFGVQASGGKIDINELNYYFKKLNIPEASSNLLNKYYVYILNLEKSGKLEMPNINEGSERFNSPSILTIILDILGDSYLPSNKGALINTKFNQTHSLNPMNISQVIKTCSSILKQYKPSTVKHRNYGVIPEVEITGKDIIIFY